MGLQTLFLPADEAIVAHGNPPRKPGNPRQFTYALLRNEGDGIASRFATVAEPFKGEPKVRAIEEVECTEQAVVLRVEHQYGEDAILHAVGVDGTRFSLVRRDLEGRIERLHLTGVGRVQVGGCILAIEKGISGRVVAVDPANSIVEIERDRESQGFRGRRLRIRFGDDSFRVGRLAVTGRNADGSGVSTRTNLYMASQGYYRGARLVDEGLRNWLPVEDVKLAPHRPGCRRDGSVALVGRCDLGDFEPGGMAFLYDFGPGDSFSVVPHATAVRRADGMFQVKGNCRADFKEEERR